LCFLFQVNDAPNPVDKFSFWVNRNKSKKSLARAAFSEKRRNFFSDLGSDNLACGNHLIDIFIEVFRSAVDD
ncbi:MAG: hypothetical protein NTV34_09905, partial [Proteobacteria bacterium]|nr:hypothetical protein [Pseudomonadota bacterium]